MSKHICQSCDGSGSVKSDPYQGNGFDVPDSGMESCTECNGTGRVQRPTTTERKKRSKEKHTDKPNKT